MNFELLINYCFCSFECLDLVFLWVFFAHLTLQYCMNSNKLKKDILILYADKFRKFYMNISLNWWLWYLISHFNNFFACLYHYLPFPSFCFHGRCVRRPKRKQQKLPIQRCAANFDCHTDCGTSDHKICIYWYICGCLDHPYY